MNYEKNVKIFLFIYLVNLISKSTQNYGKNSKKTTQKINNKFITSFFILNRQGGQSRKTLQNRSRKKISRSLEFLLIYLKNRVSIIELMLSV